MISTIYRFDHTLNLNSHKQMFTVFVAPHIHYCQPVWANSNIGLLKQMNRVLLRAARIIINNCNTELKQQTYKMISIVTLHALFHSKMFVICLQSFMIMR